MRRFLTFKKFYRVERELGSSFLFATRNAYTKANIVEDHHKEILLKYHITGGSWLLNFAIGKTIEKSNNQIEKEFEKLFRKNVNKLVFAKKTEGIAKIGQRIQEMGLNLIEDEDPDTNKTVWQKIYDKLVLKSKDVSAQAQKQLEDKDTRGAMMNKMVEYTKLYHESVQNLLEGQREVVKDENFKFEDGRTVRDKMDAFEIFLKNRMPKFSLKHKLKIPSGEQKNE